MAGKEVSRVYKEWLLLMTTFPVDKQFDNIHLIKDAINNTNC